MCFSDIVYSMVYCTCIIITKCGCVFLKLGESIYVAMDLIPILLGSLPLAHNAQHSLVLQLCRPRLGGTTYKHDICAWLYDVSQHLVFLGMLLAIVIMASRSTTHFINVSRSCRVVNQP